LEKANPFRKKEDHSMIRVRFVAAGAAALLAALLAGCQKPDLSEMMKPPQRPAELDRLEMLAGDWEGAGEMTAEGSDQIMTFHGAETMSWDADRWLLVDNFEYEMGDKGTMRGMGVMMWDAKAKKYRSWSFDNFGESESGTATYDEETKTWHFKSKGCNLVTGESYVGAGTAKMVDGDTQDWNFTIWDGWGLRKLMKISGTSQRK
jgi:hypothetical protein